MMGFIRQVGALILVVALASCASESLGGAADRDLKLCLSVSIKEKNNENVPVFTISIRNVTKAPIVVLDPRRYVPSVAVELSPWSSMRICDPAGPRKEDYVTLPPGEVVEAAIEADVLCFGTLASGKYEATAGYRNWNYWRNIWDTYRSNTVSFVIKN